VGPEISTIKRINMKVHRVVTAKDPGGKSIFAGVADAPATHDYVHIPGMSITQLWSTAPKQGSADGSVDPTRVIRSIVPAYGGTQFMIVSFPPDTVMQSADFDPGAAVAENLAHAPGLAECFERDSPGMHTTATVDYGIVLRGEITLELDDGRVEHLQEHDVVIQNATRHAWRNPGKDSALMAFVMVGVRNNS
jgi:hypothetical protein